MGIRLLWVAVGISIGALGVLLSQTSLQPETSVTAKLFLETDPKELISIENQLGAIAKRKELVRFIWGPKGLPAGRPEKVDSNVSDDRYSSLRNLKQINRLTIGMEWGLISTGYHFIPVQGNGKLVVFHGGHDGDFVSGIEIIRFFLDNGFSVIGLSMPLEDPNNRPVVDLNRIGRIQLTFHDQLKLLEMESGDPVQLFLTPITVSLNYAQNFKYESVYMTGVSGGGWTTTVYAAIDPRVTRSYPVAGSLPLHLREDRKRSNTAHRAADWGDYEQTIPELYSIANYLELYILSALGPNRKQLQILNKYDPCCLAGDAYKTYESVVKEQVRAMGSGDFGVYLDTTQRKHAISSQALKVMLEDISQVSQVQR